MFSDLVIEKAKEQYTRETCQIRRSDRGKTEKSGRMREVHENWGKIGDNDIYGTSLIFWSNVFLRDIWKECVISG